MSDIPTDYRDRLNLREQVVRIDDALARIDRQREETQKFVAEQHKLMAESDKLRAEEKKLGRDRAFLPWTVTATLLGAGAALFAAGAGFIKLIGG